MKRKSLYPWICWEANQEFLPKFIRSIHPKLVSAHSGKLLYVKFVVVFILIRLPYVRQCIVRVRYRRNCHLSKTIISVCLINRSQCCDRMNILPRYLPKNGKGSKSSSKRKRVNITRWWPPPPSN